MDPATIGAIGAGAGAAGNLVGGILGYKGTKDTNKSNREIAEAQMRFQERMSSTAHQRQVADLRAAGLNPILSATGGSGASAPAGAGATMQAPDFSFVGSAMRDGVTSGVSLAQARSNITAQDASTAKTVQETLNAVEQQKVIQAEAAGINIANARMAGMTPHEINKLMAESDSSLSESMFKRRSLGFRLMESRANSELATNASELARQVFGSKVSQAKSEASSASSESRMKRAQVPAVQKQSELDVEYAESDRVLGILNKIIDGVGSALGWTRIFRPRGKKSPPPKGKK